MKLKLRFIRGGAPVTDLFVTVDPATSVGALAEFLAGGDPDGAPRLQGEYTLALDGLQRQELGHDELVADSALRSGSTVALVPRSGHFAGDRARPAAAVIIVVSGPDAGKEFPVASGTSLIGRDPSCEVRLSDDLVSRQHARVHVTDVVEVVDLGSANGLLDAEDLVDRKVLRPGETLRIGETVIAARVVAPGAGAELSTNAVPFNRPPRVEPRYAGVKFTAPEPPDPPRQQRLPIIPLFAPLVMGAVIYMITKATTAIVFMAMSPVMMVGNVLEGRLTGRRAHRAAVEQFHDDVTALVEEVEAEQRIEVARRHDEHPAAGDCLAAAAGLTSLLWSRWPDLPGFGELRFGLGAQTTRSEIELPGGKQNNRQLWRSLREAIAPLHEVGPVPIIGDIGVHGALGVGGPREELLGVARSLIVQLAALHSPRELVVAALCTRQGAADWEWLKWLPHVLSAQSPLIAEPLASTQSASSQLLEDLERIVRDRLDGNGGEGSTARCAVIVVVEDGVDLDRRRLVDLATSGAEVGIHLLWLASDLTQLPAICRSFVEVAQRGDGNGAGFVHLAESVQPLALESVSLEQVESFARALAPVIDAVAGEDASSELPRNVSMLTLAGVELANSPAAVIERWIENRSVLTGRFASSEGLKGRPANLRAVVGSSASGPHVLDLRTHGPHALVGGTTGSGKSELLQSWILGMALSNSPQRLTFLLVDYKGGSAFSDCVNLPHTVGLVTDLSPHLVRRALTSLIAELRFREHVLHRKGAKDLAALERMGDPDAPPSLVIVVDEFAALVQEVPEFVDGVVNIAQRGRSLGLHLILATQRPSGVIKDNLRANTNLRLALRMADEADSSDVIGTKEAAHFDPSLPGRAVSRTGPTQLVPFQAAYVGGRTAEAAPDPVIEVTSLGFGPRRTWEAPQRVVPVDEDDATDIQRLVRTIGSAQREAGLPSPRVPWLSELAQVYDLAKLPNPRRDDELVFAVADDPEQQAQPIVAFHPDRDGNFSIYGTGGAGKSTALRTFAASSGFTVRGGPCQVYAIDFGSRGLQLLEVLPHVGSVVAGTDHERIGRLLSMLRETIDERALRYSSAGAGTITDYRRLSGRIDEQRLLLLVDGMGAFRTAYEGTEFNRQFETFLAIAGDGRPVGIHVIISADRVGAVPTSLNALVQRRLVLRLADANDYAMLGLPTDVIESTSPPGRGLLGGTELQVAVLGDRADIEGQAAALAALAAAMRSAGVADAAPIERLAEEVLLESLPDTSRGLPVFGVAATDLGPIGFEPSGTITIAGPPGSGRTTALATLIASLQRFEPSARLFYVGNRRSPLNQAFAWERSSVDATSAAELAEALSSIAHDSDPSECRCVLVIEGIYDYLGGTADLAIQEAARQLLSNGHLLVSDGEPTQLNGSFPLLVMARSSRVGIVFQPEQSDAALFRTQFPRVRRSDFPPGRGYYVPRGGQPVVVQVAMGSAAH